MVIVDRLTKRAKFIATQTTDSAEDIANVFMNSYAFRPQTDGQTERTKRFIGDYLRGVINPAQNDWDEFHHWAEFAYNRRRQIQSSRSWRKQQEFLLRQEAFLKVAQDRTSEAQERMKHYYDKNRLVQDFKIGDMVLLDGKNLDIGHKGYAQSKKLAPRFIGPFPVQKKFSTSLLKPYRKDRKRRQQVDKVVLADGTEGQLVEAVINHRKYKGKLQYKIWWLGETNKEATWEPVENLKQISGLIDLY
ncbi:hypothetical protein L917_03935 [Phytophthora nicotianae]|uniref:Chromo domain-containing protein n=1 Tax=Phytophthora nicotianae TaxID=4792 RepID=W2LR57_PHYNI|nr:hypothetical protein L917_03935 [Phytophthora nicotianae]